MTKYEFLAALRQLYLIANNSDSSELALPWTDPAMAGYAFCGPVDVIIRNMTDSGVLTEEDVAEWSAM